MPQTFYLEISVTPDVDGTVYDCTRVAQAFENGTATEALCEALEATVELVHVTTDDVKGANTRGDASGRSHLR